MYYSIDVRNFRCFEELTFESMARVNLIAGFNNAGKTALLEALRVHTAPGRPDISVHLGRIRRLPKPDPARLMHDFFYNFDPAREIELSVQGDWNSHPRTLKIGSRPLERGLTQPLEGNGGLALAGGPGNFSTSTTQLVFEYTDEHGRRFVSSGWWTEADTGPMDMGPNAEMTLRREGMQTELATPPDSPSCVFLSARHRTDPEMDAKKFSELEMEGQAEVIVRSLNAISGRVRRLATLAASVPPMLYADVGLSRLVPVGMLGDGMGRILSVALSFHEAAGGILLIDEVENGIHHSVLKSVWRSLYQLAIMFDVQVFATTHSLECVKAARDAFKAEQSQDLHAHRLQLQDGRHQVTTYPFDALDYTLDYGAEVR